MVAAKIDRQASTISLRTRAKGMLSRLAHDLEIDASSFEGDVELDGDAWSAELVFPVKALRVKGAVKGKRVDPSVLSAKDKADIEGRIQKDHLPFAKLTVKLSGKTRDTADVTVIAQRGRQSLTVKTSVEERSAGTIAVLGELTLSLRTLGIAEIKGPLGAFRVDDAIAVAFHVVLATE